MSKTPFSKAEFISMMKNLSIPSITRASFNIIALIWVCLGSIHDVASQNTHTGKPDRTISWSELIDQWQAEPTREWGYAEVNNCSIRFDESKDLSYLNIMELDTTQTSTGNKVLGPSYSIIFSNEDGFYNEKLEYQVIDGFNFKRIRLSNSYIEGDIYFRNCRFENNLEIINSKCTGTIMFDNCFFGSTKYDQINFSSTDFHRIIINNCEFANGMVFHTRTNELKIYDSFIPLLELKNSYLNTLTIINCTITKYGMKSDTCSSFKFDNCWVDTMIIDKLSVTEAVDILNSSVCDRLSINNWMLPVYNNVYFPWKSLNPGVLSVEKKMPDLLPSVSDVALALSEEKTNEAVKNERPIYFALSDPKSVMYDDVFSRLSAQYRYLMQLYRLRGDRSDANACYVEMKDLETRRARYLWEQDRSLGAWFDWRLNQFLKYFCDYGTSPVKALIRSMWTILLFALLYFFFYSDWDRINRGFLIRQHRRLLRYFRSEIRLEELYHEDYQEEYRSYEDYRRELEESRVEVPYYIHLLGRPLYHLSLLRHRAMGAVYRRLEVLGGVWKELPPRRQWVTGALVGVAVGGYLVHLALVRTLNSVMLSINTFSTLGFGDIPVRGWIRYAAILEGFLGWFLLSIFSVSLISQILQV